MRTNKAIAFSAIVCLFLLAVPLLGANPNTGSVCVASRPDDPWFNVAPPDATNTPRLPSEDRQATTRMVAATN
jgi:hypothetical protein